VKHIKRYITESREDDIDFLYNLGLLNFRVEGAEFIDVESETRAAIRFVDNGVRVVGLEMILPDEYNGQINIELSNGDKVEYLLEETRTPQLGQTTPPFYKFYLMINRDIITRNLDDVLVGGSTVVGDILNYYLNNKKLD
jgi:hypothetical protein